MSSDLQYTQKNSAVQSVHNSQMKWPRYLGKKMHLKKNAFFFNWNRRTCTHMYKYIIVNYVRTVLQNLKYIIVNYVRTVQQYSPYIIDYYVNEQESAILWYGNRAVVSSTVIIIVNWEVICSTVIIVALQSMITSQFLVLKY